jgi:predicted aconitase with swiveling domain
VEGVAAAVRQFRAEAGDASMGVRYDMSKKKEIIIRGRAIYPGRAEGEALVSKMPMMGWGNVKADAGYTVERGHPLYEVPFKGKVLILPYVRGSGGFVSYGHTKAYGSNPIAMLVTQAMSIPIMAGMILKQPTMTDFDIDPVEAIETGDYVIVDADAGQVRVIKGGR